MHFWDSDEEVRNYIIRWPKEINLNSATQISLLIISASDSNSDKYRSYRVWSAHRWTNSSSALWQSSSIIRCLYLTWSMILRAANHGVYAPSWVWFFSLILHIGENPRIQPFAYRYDLNSMPGLLLYVEELPCYLSISLEQPFLTDVIPFYLTVLAQYPFDLHYYLASGSFLIFF
jgi:hypothetical protein